MAQDQKGGFVCTFWCKYEAFYTISTPSDIKFWYSSGEDLTFGNLYNHFVLKIWAFFVFTSLRALSDKLKHGTKI